MSVLIWLLVPVIATVLAFVFVGLRSRPERPMEADQGMADLDRMRAAMARPQPNGRAEASIDLRDPSRNNVNAA